MVQAQVRVRKIVHNARAKAKSILPHLLRLITIVEQLGHSFPRRFQ
jgi:hypothetical protein